MKTIIMTTITALAISGSASAGIGPDKYLHAAGGLLTAATGKAIGFTDKQSCAASLAVGIAKEIIDPIFSLPDVVATAIVCVPLLLSNDTTVAEVLPADFSPAIPYPGWAQVGIMYSKDDGTFFKATASEGGVTHTRYTADREVSSSIFIPYNDGDADNGSGGTESAIAALVAGGMTREQAAATVATSEAARKVKKGNGNSSNTNGNSGSSNGNGASTSAGNQGNS